MLKELVGKTVAITVGFTSGSYQGGSIPKQYIGKVLDVNEEYCKINVDKIAVDIGLR